MEHRLFQNPWAVSAVMEHVYRAHNYQNPYSFKGCLVAADYLPAIHTCHRPALPFLFCATGLQIACVLSQFIRFLSLLFGNEHVQVANHRLLNVTGANCQTSKYNTSLLLCPFCFLLLFPLWFFRLLWPPCAAKSLGLILLLGLHLASLPNRCKD